MEIKLLDVVALVENMPEHGLRRGQVGTVVEILDKDVYVVEFSDDRGRTYWMGALHGEKLMMLYYESAITSG